jgi:hypothetical protein
MKKLVIALVIAPVLTLAQAPAAPAAPAEPAKPQAAAPAAPPAAAGQAIAVADARMGTSVEALQLVGEAASFPSTVGKVFCWTKVTGGAGQSITHAWSFNGEKASEVTLPLRYDSVRTYSYKTIAPEMKGAWKVDVLGPDGAVLKTVEFQVAD